MEGQIELKELKEETISKANKILSQDTKEELENDKIVKLQIKIIFSEENTSNTIKYPDIKETHCRLLSKLIELISSVFNISKDKRNNLYEESINKIEDKKIRQTINELKAFEIIDIDIANNLTELFKIISDSLDKKTDFTFSEYLDSVFMTLSFVPKLELLLKYQIYSYIKKNYLIKFGVDLDFLSEDININDDISIALINDLFKSKNVNDELFVQSIIILLYNPLRSDIIEYPLEKIKEGIKEVSANLKNLKKSSIFIEKLIVLFTDEINMPERIRERRKKRREKKEKKDGDKKEEVIILNKDNKDKNEIKGPLEVFDSKKDIIQKKYEEIGDNIFDFKKNINQLFNDLLNKIKIGNNDDIKKELDDIKNVIFGLSDENNNMNKNLDALTKKNITINNENKKMKDDIDKLINENKKMKDNIENLTNENKRIKKDIENLENNCKDMKKMVGDIQIRDLSKNFLKYVKSYLIKNNINVKSISKESRGKEYSEKIRELFSEADERKLVIVQGLIKNSAELANKRDYFKNSLFLENYMDLIEDYKDKNKLDKMISPEIFCFLISLRICDNNFEESFSFLSRFFNKDLGVINKDIDIFETYFD